MADRFRRGQTYEGAGPHEGHTITVLNVKHHGTSMGPNPEQYPETLVDVRCSCGNRWQFDAEAEEDED